MEDRYVQRILVFYKYHNITFTKLQTIILLYLIRKSEKKCLSKLIKFVAAADGKQPCPSYQIHYWSDLEIVFILN